MKNLEISKIGKSFLKRKGGLLFLLGVIAVIISCDPKDSVDESNPPDTQQSTDWKIGTAKSYDPPTTANSSVHDEITGLDFKFPDGSDGKLTITRIVSATNGLLVVQDSAFRIEYTGTKKLQLLLKTSTSSDDFLARYTNFENNVCYDGGNLEGWLPEKVTSVLNGNQIFDVNLSNSFTKAGLTSWERQPIFKVIRYNKTTGWGSMSSTFKSQMNTYRETIKAYIPDARQQKFYNDAIMNMPPGLFIEMQWTWFKGGPKYVPYYSFFPAVNRNLIFMDYQSTTKNLAHEWGHYVSHVLMGDAFVSFAKNPRPNKPDNHCVGMPGAKNNLIEEYAYLTEYFLAASVGSNQSPERGTFCVNSYKSGSNASVTNEPAKNDFPDLEGFGVTLFASIVRTTTSISNFNGKTVSVPAVAPSLPDRKELFKICYEIVAQGTNDIYEVRNKIESAIQTKFGKTDLLPAMLQPLGWSYHITGRFVDKDGKVLEGVSAQSLTVADTKEYLLPKGVNVSDKNGFKLEEVYPGTSSLRLVYNGKTIDVKDKIKIDWTKPTNVEINVGDIVVDEEDLMPYLSKTIVAAVQFEAMFSTSRGNFPLKQLIDNNSAGEKISWGGQSFSVTKKWTTTNGPYNKYDKNVTISGTLAKYGTMVESCTASYDESWYEVGSAGSSLLRTIKTKITCTSIPFNSIKADKKTISYILLGSAVQNKATMTYSEVWSDGTGLTSQNVIWTDQSVNPTIAIVFMAP